jgi:hypothetical protein
MSNEHVEAKEQDEHRGAVFQVAVKFTNNPAQTKEPNNFEGAEQAPDSLKTEKDQICLKFTMLDVYSAPNK